ncbi:hypothetical protein AMECASPLE_019841 [Ameca splendens]|uniref:Uncharacterized protein n=1 Tax=Ameca splendens TaxID=208324 RepID=A0ABV1A9K5_9TELE
MAEHAGRSGSVQQRSNGPIFSKQVVQHSRLENWLRVHLLSCISLLDEVSEGAITIIFSLFFPIEGTPGSVLLCSFCVSALFPQTLCLYCKDSASRTSEDFFLKFFGFICLCHFKLQFKTVEENLKSLFLFMKTSVSQI